MSVFLLLTILLICFLLTLTSNYLVFVRLYFLQILSVLLIFIFMHGNLFWHDIGMLVSFIIAVAVRLFFIPMVIYRFLSRGSFKLVERKMYFGTFANLIIMLVGTLGAYTLTLKIFGQPNLILMTSLILVFSWFLILVNHKKIIGDILWFLVLENWLFLISIALVQWLNVYIETGILADILMSLVIFGISAIKIRQIYGTLELKKLSNLRD